MRMDVPWNVLCSVCIRCLGLLGLRGLGKKRAPQKDGRPEEKCYDAERFRERESELREGEGVDCGEGEEAER